MIENLGAELQEVIKFNYEYSANFFFVMFFLCVSAFYVFYYKPKVEQPTNLFSKAITRFMFTVVANVSIFITPFALFLVNPKNNNNAFVNIYSIFYVFYIVFLVLIFFADFFRYMPFVILKMAGLDPDDEEVNKLYRKMEKEVEKIPFLRKIRK